MNSSEKSQNRPKSTRHIDATQLAFDAVGHGATALNHLSNHITFGRIVRAGVHYESFVRRTLEAPPSALLGPLSPRRKKVRARRREVALRPGAASRDTSVGVPSVAISWHEGGTGTPLLLLNGWTASGLMWPSAWIASLERDFRVIRPDNRGSGWSRNAPLPCTIADMAADTAKLLKRLKIDSAVVLGFSMGGMIAQELAIRHPSLVSGLILTGTRPPAPLQLSPSATVLKRVMSAPKPGQTTADYHRTIWPTFAAPGFADKNPDLIDEMIGQIMQRPMPRRLMLDQTRAIASWIGPARLAKIAAPTIVVHGSADLLMPVGNGLRLTRAISGARYIELPGVGHLTAYESPHELSSAIRQLAGAPAAK